MDENLSLSNESDNIEEDYDNLESVDGVSLDSGEESNMEGGGVDSDINSSLNEVYSDIESRDESYDENGSDDDLLEGGAEGIYEKRAKIINAKILKAKILNAKDRDAIRTHKKLESAKIAVRKLKTKSLNKEGQEKLKQAQNFIKDEKKKLIEIIKM